MRKLIFLLLLIIFNSCYSYAQKEAYNWYMCYKVAFNFATAPPTVLTNCVIDKNGESSVSMSDSAGNLLYYSDGETVWNKNHQIMSNGTGLLGNFSAHYGVGTVKIAPNKYMLTTVDDIGHFDGLHYHIIDMTLNNGLGEVTKKNEHIYGGNLSECITILSHTDSNKFWIVASPRNTDTLLSFLITDSVVSTMPVVSIAKHSFGLMFCKASVSGDQLVVRADTLYNPTLLDLYDFDALTGKFSNGKTIFRDSFVINDFAYSHDGRFLYVASNKFISIGDIKSKLVQLDMSSGIDTAISSSQTMIYDYRANSRLMGVELGPDKKIYVARNKGTKIGVVDKPYFKGSNCNYQHDGLIISNDADQRRTNFHFPAFYGKYIPRDPVIEIEKGCPGDTVKFNVMSWVNNDSILWIFDDTASLSNNYSKDSNTSHIYAKGGNYKVAFVKFKFGRSDTTFIQVDIPVVKSIDLGPDTFYCDGSPISVDYREFMPSSFKWSHGLTQPQITYYGSGEYWVEITDTNGCIVSDTIVIDKKPAFKYRGTRDFLRCDRDTLLLDVGVGADIYKWSNGDTGSIVKLTTTDKYYVEFTLGDCITNDSFTVEFKPVPIFDFGSDTIICNTDSITIGGTSGVKHLWNTGDTTEKITIKPAGTYILTQNTQYCEWKDTIELGVQQQPSINIGNDTVVCFGEKAIMGATIPNGIQYTWNNRGDATPKITTDSQSTYSVIAYDGVCRAYDTIFVGVYTPQSIELGNDSTLCEGTQTFLDATIFRGKYQWNDGAQTPTKLVNLPGNYSVLVTDSVCQYSDLITIGFISIPLLELGPDTFLCQEEVYELTVDNSWEKITWSDGSNQYNRIFTTEDKYVVTADYLNCQATDSITINYYPALPNLDLGPDVDVCDPLFYPLQGNYTGYYGIVWQDGTEGDTYEVTETGDYIISTKPHRCGQVNDTVHITFLRELCDLHVPTAFSPNGDGRNDTFFPVGYQMDVESMQIFNRWGELLYSGPDGWDGTYKGEPVPAGNYLYIITYKKEHRGGKKRMFTKGTVLIIR